MICCVCKISKKNNCFYFKSKKSKKLSNICKTCLYFYQNKRWKERKRKAIAMFGGRCSKCGYNKNLSALEFHHLSRKEKKMSWTEMRLASWDRTIIELKKCILLCANCHREEENPNDTIISDKDSSIKFVLNDDMKIKSTGSCPHCNNLVYGTKYCSRLCVQKSRRKAKRPEKKELVNLLRKHSFCEVGRMFGVSDNAIRKWLKY